MGNSANNENSELKRFKSSWAGWITSALLAFLCWTVQDWKAKTEVAITELQRTVQTTGVRLAVLETSIKQLGVK
jgi:hypothetical protein